MRQAFTRAAAAAQICWHTGSNPVPGLPAGKGVASTLSTGFPQNKLSANMRAYIRGLEASAVVALGGVMRVKPHIPVSMETTFSQIKQIILEPCPLWYNVSFITVAIAWYPILWCIATALQEFQNFANPDYIQSGFLGIFLDVSWQLVGHMLIALLIIGVFNIGLSVYYHTRR